MRVLTPGEFGTGRAERDRLDLSAEVFEAGTRVGDHLESFIDPDNLPQSKRSGKRPNRHRLFDLDRDGAE